MHNQSNQLVGQLWEITQKILDTIKHLDAPAVSYRVDVENETEDLKQLDEYFQQREEDIQKLGQYLTDRQVILDQLNDMNGLDPTLMDPADIANWSITESEIQDRMRKLHLDRSKELKKIKQAKQSKSTYTHSYETNTEHGSFIDRKN